MKRKAYYMTETAIRKLEEEKKKTGLSMSEIIRRAVDHYFENRKDVKNDLS